MPKKPLPDIIADPVFQRFTAQEKARILDRVDPLFSQIDPSQRYQAVQAAEQGWEAYHVYRKMGYEKIKPPEVPGFAEQHPLQNAFLALNQPLGETIGGKSVTEMVKPYLPEPGQPGVMGGVKQAIGMTGRLAAGLLDMAQTPAQWPSLAASIIAPAAAPLLFGAPMTLGTIEAAKEFHKNPTPENAERMFVSAAMTTALVHGGAKQPQSTSAKLVNDVRRAVAKSAKTQTATPKGAATVADQGRSTQGSPGPPTKPTRQLPAGPPPLEGPEVFEPYYQTGRESRIGPAWQRPSGPYIAPGARPERFDFTGRAPEVQLGSSNTIVTRAPEVQLGSSNTIVTRESYATFTQNIKDFLNPNRPHDIGDIGSILPDLAKAGVFWIEAGVREFVPWSAKMVEAFGESVRPHLRRIYDEAITFGKSASQKVEDRLLFRTAEVQSAVQEALNTLTPEAQIIKEEGGKTFERGTVPKERQTEFYEPARPSSESTYDVSISQRMVDDSRIRTEQARLAVESWLLEVRNAGDAASINAGQAVLGQLNLATQYFREVGTISGRLLAMRQKKAGIPSRVAAEAAPSTPATARPVAELPTNVQDLVRQAHAAIQSANNLLSGIQKIKSREPIYNRIYSGIKNHDVKEVLTASVDAIRFNYFSPFAWVFDLAGNTAELGAQVAEAAGRDIAHVATTGEVRFASIAGFMEAIRERAERAGTPMQSDIESGLGFSAYGENLPLLETGTRRPTINERLNRPGIFTKREGIGEEGTSLRKSTKALSTGVDLGVGAALYAKGAVDTAAKRVASTAVLWREAITLADARKITEPTTRRRFIREFVDNPPEWAKQAAIAQGNKAGMNRPLGPIARGWSHNLMVRLLVEPFPGWAPQLMKWAGEMLGYNRPLLDKMISQKVTPQEIGGYLAKTMVGYGGLYFLSQVVYPHIDFKSMEYVHEDENRTRFSNLDPATSGLVLLAALKGDWEKFSYGLPYASVPGAKLLPTKQTGFPAGGGLLGGAISGLGFAINNPQNDPRALKRELTLMLNRAIPGQALLGAIKTALDPTQREGVGANLPGVSFFKEPRIQLTTGEPRKPTQEIPGIGLKIPQVQGVPIPGAQRTLDPIEKLLARYQLEVYRPLRQPIAGAPAANVLPQYRQEWEMELGKQRQAILGPIVQRDQKGEFKNLPRQQVREMISRLDSLAGRLATMKVNERHGNKPRPPARPSPQLLAGPQVYQEQAVGR